MPHFTLCVIFSCYYVYMDSSSGTCPQQWIHSFNVVLAHDNNYKGDMIWFCFDYELWEGWTYNSCRICSIFSNYRLKLGWGLIRKSVDSLFFIALDLYNFLFLFIDTTRSDDVNVNFGVYKNTPHVSSSYVSSTLCSESLSTYAMLNTSCPFSWSNWSSYSIAYWHDPLLYWY